MADAFNRERSAATRDQWTYATRPGNGLWLVSAAVLSVLIASILTIAMTGLSRGAGAAVIVMTAGVMALASRAHARTAVTIDRRKGVIRIMTLGVLGNRSEERTLSEFDKVAVWERRTPIDAGYYASQYSIVLLGGKGPLPLLSTDDEREASSVRDEVALFLRFSR